MMELSEPRVLALLYLDLVGYSRLLSGDDITRVVRIETEMAAIRDLVESSGGVVGSRAGDSFVITFATVPEALDVAFKIQNRIAERTETDPLVFRIGVHFGEVVLHHGRPIGNAVNVTARLEGAAEPGAICMSRAAYEAATADLQTPFVYHGEVQFKNIDGPIEVFTARIEGKTFTPARAAIGTSTLMANSRPTIVVRPFAALTPDPKTTCFADGVTTDLIFRLSRFRHLNVIGCASSFALDSRAMDERAAHKVNARYVANGACQIIDDRLRLTAMLTDTETNHILWAERFDRKLDDFFEVQNEIEELATVAMAVCIDLAEQDATRARDPSNLDAYSLVVKGRLENYLDGATGREATSRAMTNFVRAAEIDPAYSAALAGIARAHAFQWLCNYTADPDRSMDASTNFALKAIEADQNDAMSHFSLGFVSLYRREHARSLAAYEQALRMNPSDVEIMAEYADALKHNGEAEKAVPIFQRALTLNPLKPDVYLSNLAHTYLVMEEFEAAIETIRQMRQPLTAQRVYTASLMLAGREEEGRQEAARLRMLEPNFSAVDWCRMVPDRLPEHNAIFREGLQRAGF